jgi:amino acid permease
MASSDHASSDALSDAANVILERLSAAGGGGTVEESMLVMDNLPPSEDPVGQATIPSEIASMAKNLIGCGCLSLSNGIARCANNSRALWTANSWIVLLGFIFGYFCYLIAKICHLTGRTTYRGIWEETVGHRGSVAVSVANALKAAMADLAYATILSDTLKSLLLGFFGWEVPRVSCLLLITGCAILPLCLLKSLNVLAPFSLLGTAGVVFTAGSMVVRYLDGSYQVGGKFHNDIPGEYLPRFGGVDESWSTAILPFVCMVYEVQ